jgi:hypothetical protein
MTIDPSAGITRLSRRMAWLVTAAFWLVIPGLALYVILFPGQLPYHGWVAIAGFEPRRLPPLVALAVFAALGAVSLPGLWGLWELKRVFEGYAAGAIFSVAAARRLRHCGYALMVVGAESPLGSLLLSAALSLDLSGRRRSLVISLSSDDLVLLLIGGVLLVIARVMGEAARIAEENAGFI